MHMHKLCKKVQCKLLLLLLLCNNHSFKYSAIAAAIACYSLLRQSAAICVHVQFSRYIPL